MPIKKVSRRDFLKAAGLAGVGLSVAACAPQSTPTTAIEPAQNNATQAPVSDSQPATAEPKPTAAPPTEVSKEPVEIVQWDGMVTQGPWIDEEIRLFQEQFPWITVRRVLQPAGSQTKDTVPLAFKDGSMPDILPISDIPLIDLITGGYVKPLTDFADFNEFKAKFPKPEIDFVEGTNTLEGKTYTAPRESRSGWWNQVYVNLDVTDAYGISELPTTAEAFIDACRKVTTDSNKEVYGYGLPFSTWMTMLWPFAFTRSILLWGQDYRTGDYIYSKEPNYQKMWETLATLREENLILPEASSIDDEGLRALFAEGKVAFITAGIWAINGWKQTNPDFQNYTVLPPFTIGDNKGTYGFYNGPGGGSWYISGITEKAEASWEWYKWLHSKEAGERWVKTGNGFSIFPENNNADFLSERVWKDFIEWDKQLNFVGPTAQIRNPDCAKVAPAAPKPDESGITSGVFSGEIKKADIAAVLAKLDSDKRSAFELAAEDAAKAGAQVKFPDDWAFPDWDPAKDYVNQPGD